jgi:acyl-CoA synthetase (NDP forming)
MAKYGIAMPAQVVVGVTDDLAGQAATIGFPVALKAIAKSAMHKSDRGAVKLNLATCGEVRAAADEMAAMIPDLSNFLIQAMAPAGIELLIGVKHDPIWGPAIVVGMGGTLVELLGDTAIRPAPLEEHHARAMVDQLRGAALLDHYRGGAACDRSALERLIVAVGRLAASEPLVRELDLNPVIVSPLGALAVDVRVVLGRGDEFAPRCSPAPDLARMVSPRSVVVIGASRDPRKPGGRLLEYLIKHPFSGPLYAVNPSSDEVRGQRSFAAVAELPEVPDLACIAVPASQVPQTIDECGRRGIRSAIVYTSGFSEIGEPGEGVAARLERAIRESGVRVCGPNTAGIANVKAGLAATIGMTFAVDEMLAGEIAFLTQSGGLGGALLSRGWSQRIGFSHWVCTGNEADLTLGDFLLYLADDPDARVIAIFMECVRDRKTFVEGCRRAAKNGKPVVVYKTGYSAIGKRVVHSHTAALAGEGAVYDAFLDSLGVARVGDLQALLDASLTFAWQPASRGRRVGVISASGGACSVIADECERAGLLLPSWPTELRQRIERAIPEYGSADNPVDVTMDVTVRPEMMDEVAEAVLTSDAVDMVVVVLTTSADPPAIDVAKAVISAAQASPKPVVVARVGADDLAPQSLRLYQEARVPVFPMPDRAVKAVKALADLAANRSHRERDGDGFSTH